MRPIDPVKLFARINECWHDFLLSLTGLPDEVLIQEKVVDQWSVKDVMTHVSAWEEAYIEATKEYHQGLRPQIFDIDWDGEGDAVNERLRQARASQTLEVTWKTLGNSHRDLVTALNHPDILAEPDMVALAHEVTWKHYHHHARAVRQYRPNQFAESGLAYHVMRCDRSYPDLTRPADFKAYSGSCEYLLASLEPSGLEFMANRLYPEYQGKLATLVFDRSKLQPETTRPGGFPNLHGHIHGWFNLKSLMDVRAMSRNQAEKWFFPWF